MKDIIEADKAMMSVVNGAFELSWALRGLELLERSTREPFLLEKCLDVVIDLGFDGFGTSSGRCPSSPQNRLSYDGSNDHYSFGHLDPEPGNPHRNDSRL